MLALLTRIYAVTCALLWVLPTLAGQKISYVHAILAIREDKPNYVGASLLRDLMTAWHLERQRKLFIHQQTYSNPGRGNHIEDNTEAIGLAVDEIIAQDARRNKSAIISTIGAGIGRSAEPHFIRALLAGISVVFASRDFPDLATHGVNAASVRMFAIWPDQWQKGEDTGREWCRMAQGTDQKVVLHYGKPAPGNAAERPKLEGALRGFQHGCPHSRLDVLGMLNTTDHGQMEAFFMANPAVTAVVSPSDARAGAMRLAAESILGTRVRSIYFLGSNNDRPDLIEHKMLVATTDNCLPCLLQTFNQTLGLVDQGVNSTTAWLAALGLLNLPLRYPAILRASDGEGHVLSKIMPGYKKSVGAIPESGAGPIHVSLGIHEIYLNDFDLSDGSFEAEFWFQQQWHDSRLSWATRQLNKTLLIDHLELWNPDVYLANIGNVRSIIYEPKAVVNHVGQIKKSTKITGDFTCDLSVAPYPFTVHTCSISVGAAENAGVELNTELGMNLLGVRKGFYAPKVISATVVDGIAHFRFEIAQKTDFALVCFAFPAYILNVVSFSAFYLPGHDDRTGLAVTAVLAQMVLQIEARIGDVFTWLDVLLALSFIFQFLAFLVSFIARRTSAKLHCLEVDEDDGDVKKARSTLESLERFRKLGKWTLTNNKLDRLGKLVLGGRETFPEDRFARRCLVPLYLFSMMVLSFQPSSGSMDITKHPDHGWGLWLFWLNNVLLLPIIVAGAHHVRKRIAKRLRVTKGKRASSPTPSISSDVESNEEDPSIEQNVEKTTKDDPFQAAFKL